MQKLDSNQMHIWWQWISTSPRIFQEWECQHCL